MGLEWKRRVDNTRDYYDLDIEKTYLVVGLGNAGPDYVRTRHNIGFRAADWAADQLGAGEWQTKDKFKAAVSEVRSLERGARIIFAKPLTMMNLSGQAVQALVSFYKLKTEDVIVLTDDIDLPFAQVRLRAGGGDGGHNGLKSVAAVLGKDYKRIRIGVSNELRERIDAADFVLQRFSAEEERDIPAVLEAVYDELERFLASHEWQDRSLTVPIIRID